ncbi:chaplin family protein [Kitasatospora sp. NPDC058444]|uniref:chaplin family protein n=1 Tax=Kitasatospora sp. NPDC058444 TaxID=3346504 RepID=UPI00364FDCAE
MATGSVLATTAGYAYAGGAEAQGVAAGSAGVVSGNSVQVPVQVPINACGNTVDVIGLLNPSFGNRCANVNGGGGQHASKPVQGGHSSAQGGQHGGGSGATGVGHDGRDSRVDGSAVDGRQGGNGPGSAVPGATTLPAAAVPGAAVPGASASGVAANSPGVLSGNSVQAPVDVPVNACGNSVNVAGVGNPAFGNDCANVEKVVPPPAPKPNPKPVEGCVEVCPTPPKVSSEEVTNVSRNGTPPVMAETAVVAPAKAAKTPPPGPGPQLAQTGAGGVELLGGAGLALMLGGGVLYRRSRAGVR